MTGTRLPERLLAVLVKISFGLLYALALSRLVLQANRLPAQLPDQALLILAVLLILALLTWTRYQVLVLTALLAVSSILAWLSRNRWQENENLASWLVSMQQRLDWAGRYLLGFTSGNIDQQQWLAQVLGVLLALLAYLAIVRFSRPFIAGGVLLVAALVVRGMPQPVFYGWVLTGGLVVLATLARHQKKTWHHLKKQKTVLSARILLQAMPPAALTLALAMLFASLVPATFFHSRRLEGLLDDLTGRISGIQLQQSGVMEFSLHQAGYYPLVDRLGGPVILSDVPVLQISGPEQAFLLKGSVSQIYDGRSWAQDPDRTYHRYDSPLWQAEQRAAFDQDIPDLAGSGLREEDFSRSEIIQWSPIGWPTRTLFTAGKTVRISLIQPDPFLAYFRPSGQMFSKYWIQPGQWIALEAHLLQTGQAAFSRTIAQAQAALEPDDLTMPRTVAMRYLQLPSLPPYEADGWLRVLAEQITAASDQPYAAVLELRDYLMRNHRYNLDVATPPADADFVSWFLETGEGYCVYFATALTMLCRLVDIPARYVEGYAVPGRSDGDRERVLTGRQAHAWTEVYLAGIGWIPVDATPGTSNPGPRPSPQITPDMTPAPDTATPTAPLSPPELTAAATPAQPGREDEAANKPFGRILLLLLFLLALLLPFGWAAWLLRTLRLYGDPAVLRAKLPDPAARVRFYWHRIRTLLQLAGQPQAAGQTPAQFLRAQTAAQGWLDGKQLLVEQAATGLNETFFGPDAPAEDAVSAMAALLHELEQLILIRYGRLRWLLLILRSGTRLPGFGKPGQFFRFVIS